MNKVCPFGIFADQAGYRPDSVKMAVLPFPADDFKVIDNNGVCQFRGKTTFWGNDKDSGDTVYRADFTGLSQNGVYRVTAGGKQSARFRIAENVYQKVFDDTLKAFYYLRCGCGLEERYAGVYKHGKCHTGRAVLWDDPGTALDVSGGWHDAGDYGRYVTAGACAAAHLLYAYKLFPAAFAGQRLGIPKSPLPDVLAECRVELEWLLKMQRQDGAVWHKLTTRRHAPFVMPEQDLEQLYLLPPSSMAAADLAAVCALASGVYEPFDKDFAARLRAAAEKSAKWLEDNPDFLRFKNPEGCTTGSYGERDDFSNRFWAWSEMYSMTGDNRYHDMLKAALDKDFPRTALGYTEWGGLGELAYLLCGHDTDKTLCERFRSDFANEAERLKGIADSCGYGCAMAEENYCWGSNMALLTHGMIFAINDFLEGGERYRSYAENQLHYLLGLNATGYSYVTGSGEFRCNYPHLRPAAADGIEECIPGMVSGGPNRDPCDEAAVRLIPKGTPPMKCYADHIGCYSLNEITIYWNSPAVFLLAYLQGGQK